MKNLKKTLAVVLAFVMVLSMGAISTFAFTDVQAGTVTDEAVGILSNLGIIEGFEDGTFKPEDTVTRAQMAAIICRTLGYESQAESSKGITVFNDVAGDHWASGYVNVAQAQGIINGYGNGNFGPEDKVTYEQAVKMIVSALGYDLAANAKGGYPTGYLAIASGEGITKNANGRVGDAAKRATIAVLVYNSLEVRLMDQFSWTTDGADEYGKTNDTILSKYLDVDKWEGIVEATPLTSAVEANQYDADAVSYATIDGKYFYYTGNGILEDADDTAVVDCSLVDANSLFGKKVVAYIGAHSDAETGRRMIYAISEKQGANEVTTINANQLVESGDTGYTTNGQISYVKDGAVRITDVKLASDVVVYNNFENTGLTVAADTADIEALLTNGGVIELISNDNDSAVDYVMVTSYDDEATIEKVTEEDGVLLFDSYTNSLDEIDTADEDVLVVVYKDGALADAKALAANDTVSVVELVGGDIRVLYASSKTVVGAVESYSLAENTVTIGGAEYNISANNGSTVSQLKDEEGTFFLNVDGDIAYNETATTAAGNYGLVLAVNYEKGISDGYTAQVVTSDGTVAVYDIANTAKLYNAAGTTVADKDFEVAAELAKSIAGTAIDATTAEPTVQGQLATVKKLAAANRDDAIFKVKIKDDKVTRLDVIDTDASSSTKEYDSESMTYGNFELDKDILVFNIKAGVSTITEEEITIGTVESFFEDGESYSFYGCDMDDVTPGVILGYGLKAAIKQDANAVIVVSTRTVAYDNDEATAITGIQGGEEVNYVLYNDTTGDIGAGLAKGDVILVAGADAEGVVDEIEVLHDAATTKATATVTDTTNADAIDDEIANGYGTLDKADTTTTMFFIDAAVDTTIGTDTYTFAAANEGIVMRKTASYTLVDYSESTKNPTIAKKSAGTSLFSLSDKYVSEVFVRVCDDRIVDVVVYRYAA